MTVANYTTSNFSGTIGAEAFDANGQFVSFIGTSSASISTNGNKTFNFTTTETSLFVPGHYQVKIFYKTTGDWIILDGGSYVNSANFDIVYSADIETYSNFAVTNNNGRLIQGFLASVNVGIKNTGSSTFNGQFKVSL